MGGCEASVFSEAAEDFGGETGLRVAEANEFEEIRSSGVVSEGCGGCGKVAINGEAKGVTDGWNAANDVGAVDGGCVPGVCGNVDGFGIDFGVTSSFSGNDGQGFVEEAE